MRRMSYGRPGLDCGAHGSQVVGSGYLWTARLLGGRCRMQGSSFRRVYPRAMPLTDSMPLRPEASPFGFHTLPPEMVATRLWWGLPRQAWIRAAHAV